MGTRVFVGNVNPQTTREELHRLFSKVGRVQEIHLPLDRDTGRQRGFAFIDYSTDAEAEQALEKLDSALLGGRRLRLSWALAKRSRPSPGELPGRSQPAAAAPAAAPDWDWSAEAPDLPVDRGSRGRRRRGGKHASDRKRRQGTRRVIE